MKHKTERPAAITDAMVACAERVLVTTAFERMIEPIVIGYQTEILKRLQLKVADEFKDEGIDRIILDPDHTYLLSDEDFQRYLAESNEARKKAQLVVEDPSQCPLLVAIHERIKAENALLKAMSEIPRLGDLRHFGVATIKQREQLLEMTLAVLSPYVRETDELMARAVKHNALAFF